VPRPPSSYARPVPPPSLPALTQGLALVFLFVVLPFAVAAGVLWWISWRSGRGPAPVRTSEVLATGDPARADVLSIRSMGGLLDARPMVRFGLRIDTPDGADLELEVTQSVPRSVLREVQIGDRVEVRLTPDRSHAAIVLGGATPAGDR